MKARIIKTGEIIDVEWICENEYHDTSTSGIDERFYYAHELDFNININSKTFKGYITRDDRNILMMHEDCPKMMTAKSGEIYYASMSPFMILPSDMFQNIKSGAEPKYTVIEIKEINS